MLAHALIAIADAGDREWASMGGENCEDCSKCIRSESALTKALGQSQANKVFAQVGLVRHVGKSSAELDVALEYLVHTRRCQYAQEAQDQYCALTDRMVGHRIAQEQGRMVPRGRAMGIEKGTQDAEEG